MQNAINNTISSATSDITTVFTTNIPLIMTIFTGLVALWLIYKGMKKFIAERQ